MKKKKKYGSHISPPKNDKIKEKEMKRGKKKEELNI